MNSLLPKMFHRRLLIISLLVVAGLAPAAVQTARLTTVRHDELRRASEARLVTRQWTPSVRGRLLDRKGRVLAQDRPSFDVAIDYEAISGAWARQTAERLARADRTQWPEFSREQRDELIRRTAGILQARVDEGLARLARAVGVERSALDSMIQSEVRRIDALYESVRARRRDEMIREATREGQAIPAADLTRIESAAARPIAEQQRPMTILRGVADARAFELQILLDERETLERLGDVLTEPGNPDSWTLSTMPGVRVIDSGDREYPLDTQTVRLDRSRFPLPMRKEGTLDVRVTGVGGHVLGWMRRRVFAEDQERRSARLAREDAFRARVTTPEGADRGEYREGDRVGSSGLEATMEDELRGLRGLRTRRLDAGTTHSLPAQAGQDVQLALDAVLQARVQAVMSPETGLASVQDWHGPANPTMPPGTPLTGAAVVLEIDTGDVLAMVSMPEISREVLRERPEELFADTVSVPFLNRAIAKPYPPGSIVKPLVLVGAAARGNILDGQAIECTGHLLPGEPTMLRCWIYKRFDQTHQQQIGHPLSPREAIKVSCNIFFFTLGKRLGPQAISELYRDFGVERAFDLGVGSEYPGSLAIYGQNRALTMGEAIQMGIGQGPITWTPLHAANAYAMLARSGAQVSPRLVLSPARPRAQREELAWPAWSVREAMNGLRDAVLEELGTGHHITVDGVKDPIFNIPGVRVLGKTGTAAAPDLRAPAEPSPLDENDGVGPGPGEIVRSGDHSWFVVLVGRDGERPRFVISVVMEYAGSGGKVSGPIVNQIIQALRDEGYL